MPITMAFATPVTRRVHRWARSGTYNPLARPIFIYVNAAALRRLLQGEPGAYRDSVLLNAGGALIVAGGANFPDKMPWDGGAKVWWGDIWVLENFSRLTPSWVRDRTFKLPRRIAYGISVSLPEGVVCVGGQHDRGDGARVLYRGRRPRLGAEAGLKAGDTIMKMGGTDTPDLQAMVTVLRAKRPGDTLAVVFIRGGKEQKVSVILSVRPGT